MMDNGTKEINFFDLLFVRGEKMLTFICTLTGRIAFLLKNNITCITQCIYAYCD